MLAPLDLVKIFLVTNKANEFLHVKDDGARYTREVRTTCVVSSLMTLLDSAQARSSVDDHHSERN
ncbi:hypothetical protein J6590_041906 [Homalodisca vitripennis]|nr:hypothetical protein J6590_041906 [Homalodisca vitripennis]